MISYKVTCKSHSAIYPSMSYAISHAIARVSNIMSKHTDVIVHKYETDSGGVRFYVETAEGDETIDITAIA